MINIFEQNNVTLYKLLTVFFSSMLPIIELRGAIPMGIALGMTPIASAVVSFLGSIVPIPLVFFLARPVIKWLKGSKLLKHRVDKFIGKTMKKSDKIIKYGFWGLIIFVGIPLPGTGVWTGALIAALLDMRFKKAIWALIIGDALAGVIVMILSHTAIGVIG